MRRNAKNADDVYRVIVVDDDIGILDSVSILIITHHTNILEYIKPDRVAILSGGEIVKIGDNTLANDIEKFGFSAYEVSEK